MTKKREEKELATLGQEIRKLWCEEMRDFELRDTGCTSNWGSRHMTSWDGGETERGRFYKPVWPEIASFCLQNNLDPRILVRSMFWRAPRAPFPNQAHGNFALERYNFYTAPGTALEIKTQIIHEFESQKARLVASSLNLVRYAKLEKDIACKSVIARRDEPFSPLFRYVVSKNQNWEEMADVYYNAALRQYLRYPEVYNAVWGDWIPINLVETTNEKTGTGA